MSEGLSRKLLDVLADIGDALVARVGADACAISRAIGDVLILVVERVPPGTTLQSGQGYLVSDYPQTAEVLATLRPRTLTLDDPDVDEAEAAILREHGYGALAMLPLVLDGEAWGLVEVYRVERRPFGDDEVALIAQLSRVR